MRRVFTVLLVVISLSNLFSQEMFTLKKSISNQSVKKKKIYKEINAWAKSQKEYANINDAVEDKITLEGFIQYTNPIIFESSANLTKVYAKQTEGKLKFELEILFSDTNCIVKLTKVKHVPNNQSDGINFGMLTPDATAPKGIIDEIGEKWSNDVWTDMKTQTDKKFESIVSVINDNINKLK